MSKHNLNHLNSVDVMTIENAVRKVLNGNSGGCKITQLITEVLSELYQQYNGTELADIVASDDFEKIINNMHEIRIFEYHWDMKGDKLGPYRTKQFVATVF